MGGVVLFSLLITALFAVAVNNGAFKRWKSVTGEGTAADFGFILGFGLIVVFPVVLIAGSLLGLV